MSRKKYSFGGGHGPLPKQPEVSKEHLTLLEFKTRIRDLMRPEYDDHYLAKWLKARNFDVPKAEQMFRASMAYRDKMDIETIKKTYKPPEVLEKYLPGGFCGYDKEGSPILIDLYGFMDMKGLLYSAKKSDIEKTKILLGESVMEMLDSQSKKLGRFIDGMTVIVDLENVGTEILWGPGIQMYAHMGKVLQDNYPEIVKRTFVINAPKIFPMIWKLIRPLITEDMKKKVCILGANYKSELLKAIDADQLPAFLGGNLVDPDGDPRCHAKICQKGKIPESYYLKELTVTDNLITATVGSGEKLKLKYKVEKAGSLLRYEFMTDGFDIGFGVFYENKNGVNDELLNVERVNSHMVPEDGTCSCKKKGTYIVIFDNSYSWTRSKTIQYNIDIVLATDNTLVKDLDTVTKGWSWDVADKSDCTKL